MDSLPTLSGVPEEGRQALDSNFSNCEPRARGIGWILGTCEKCNFGPHSRPIESESAFKQDLQGSACTFQSEKLCLSVPQPSFCQTIWESWTMTSLHPGQELMGCGLVHPHMGQMVTRGEEEKKGRSLDLGLRMAFLSQPSDATVLSPRGQPATEALCKAVFLKLWVARVSLGSGVFFLFLILHFNFNDNLKKITITRITRNSECIHATRVLPMRMLSDKNFAGV